MKIAVIGANGQLGIDVVSAFRAKGDDVIGLTHSDVELSEIDSLNGCLRDLDPQIIVNTAAMHHVENCEREPERAFAVNALGVRNLSSIAREIGTVLLHVSTDYVFDGGKRKPYEEFDAPNPLNVYGNTKLAGEYFVRSTVEKHFVLRTSAIYGQNPCRAKGGLNFIELMLKLAKERGEVRVVDTEFVTPTSTMDLARQIVNLSKSDAYGLYHATAEGSCSWYEFAREIFAVSGVSAILKAAGPNDFPAKVPRPTYTVLENRRLKENGLNIFKPWQEGVREYFLSRPHGSKLEAGLTRHV
jgi:dTDP-4-dehydrorhamnose reductase